MAKPTAVAAAEKALEALARDMEMELVDVELAKEAGSTYLRICLDKEGGVGLSDCEAFHRRAIPLVESVAYDFLECSSPGLDRPLKRARDFQKHLGQQVEVRLFRPLYGMKVHVGTLLDFADGVFSLRAGDRELSFSMKETALVKPVIDWDKDFEQLKGDNR